MNIRSVGAVLFHDGRKDERAEGQTDRQTHMAKLIVALRKILRMRLNTIAAEKQVRILYAFFWVIPRRLN